jgi:hypothetical protein
LTYDQLVPIVVEARARWAATGLPQSVLSRLDSVPVEIAALGGALVGEALAGVILIDPTAAGAGWFVDPTPSDDAEFATHVGESELAALPGSPAYGKIDLLTVVLHEMGHELGFDHSADPLSLMFEDLGPGLRREPPVASSLPRAAITYAAGDVPAGPHDAFAAPGWSTFLASGAETLSEAAVDPLMLTRKVSATILRIARSARWPGTHSA